MEAASLELSTYALPRFQSAHSATIPRRMPHLMAEGASALLERGEQQYAPEEPSRKRTVPGTCSKHNL